MNQSPRNKLAFIITPAMSKWIICFGVAFIAAIIAYVYQMPAKGMPGHDQALTMLFTAFVLLQFWNLFNARVYGTNNTFLKGLFANKAFLLIMGVILIGQILAVEFGGEVFRTVHLSATDWLILLAVTSPVLIVGEIVRAIGRAKN